ncbi:MAG: aminodeoxychorismate/anthranilate synthase component II [Planctomycetota bacterium]
MIVVIDNYDSFTFNLVQRMGEIDPDVDVKVVRNDEMELSSIRELSPERVLISPGPCTPSEAGVSVNAVTEFLGVVPVLGVCLGHQSMGQSLGANIIRAPELMHGKTDEIHHDGKGLFAGLSNPFIATRYHSLVIDPSTVPNELEVSAWTDTGGERQIMGVRHKEHLMEGWQFHPESFLTEPGVELIRRFLTWGCTKNG